MKELEALAHGEMPSAAAAAEAPAPKPAAKPAPAPVAAAPVPTDDSGFQPIPFSFGDFGDEEETGSDLPAYEIVFKPRSDLYSKGNDATLLLRDLSRLGEMSIYCNTDALVGIDEIDPEAAYFFWNVTLRTDKGEDAIRTVFEFAEWDCDLTITPVEDAKAAEASNDELPMVPVPFDLSVLDEGAETPAETAKSDAAAAVAAAETASNVTQMAAAASASRRRNRPPLPALLLQPLPRTTPLPPAPARRSASISIASTA